MAANSDHIAQGAGCALGHRSERTAAAAVAQPSFAGKRFLRVFFCESRACHRDRDTLFAPSGLWRRGSDEPLLMGGKAKPKKHTAAELAAKVAAHKSQGGGAVGMAERDKKAGLT